MVSKKLDKCISFAVSSVMLFSLISTVSLTSFAATAQDIVNNGDMENSTNWWHSNGGEPVVSVSDVKHGGSYCIKATGRENPWEGVAQNLTGNQKGDPIAGTKYHGAAWVMFDGETAPDSVTFRLSIKRNNGTKDNYDNIKSFAVTKGQWTLLEGDYTLPADTDVSNGVHIYLETNESESFVDFYADDISFKEPSSTVSLNGSDSLITDFENGDVSGWTSRGSEKVSITKDISHNGSYSIATTGRTNSWNGPSHTLMGVVNFDTSYQFSAYVMYNDGPDTQSVNMSIQKDNDSGASYTNIGSLTLTKGKWALIEGNYTVNYDSTLTNISLYFEAPGSELVDFYIDDVKVSGGNSLDFDPNLTSLYSVWDKYFPLGAAISPEEIQSPIYSAYINKHYSSLTPANCMKPDALQPTEGMFTFNATDKIAVFAQENNKLMRGHTLLWHNQIPSWFFTDPQDSTKPATSEMLLGRLKTHIETVMTHYNGRIHTYDVVNEVLSDKSGLRGDDENSKWKSIVGDVDKDGLDDDYILAAFKYAFQTAIKIGDDKVKFCINDYNLESSTKKLDDMYNLTKRILEVAEKEGISKDRIVVGFQMHISIYSPSNDQIRLSLEKIASLGVKIQVTELDMSIYKSSSEPKKTATEEILLLQAKKYKDVFDIFKDEAIKGNLDTVTIWGIDDGGTWLNDFPVKGRPDPALLFNSRLQAKPAYTALTDPDKLPVDKQQITAKKGTPSMVGGNIDKVWNAIKCVDVNNFVLGTEGATAKVKTMWDSENIYILAQVNDSTKNDEDSFVIYFDKKTGNSADNESHTISRKLTDGDSNGYIVQTSIPISDIKPTQGTKLGIDFKVIDHNATGTVSSEVVWNDIKNKLGTSDTSGYGNILLDKEAKLLTVNYGAPVIDGTIDTIWDGIESNDTSIWLNGTSGSTAKFKTLWADGKLFVLADVTDSLLSKASTDAYQQDSIEIFIDQDNAKNSVYDSNDHQIRINFDNEVSYNPSELLGFKSATSKTQTGYVVEAEIPLNASNAKEGSVMGFDLQVNNDEDDDGTRDSASIWYDQTGLSYKDVSNIGNIILGEKSSSETKVSGYINPGFSSTSGQESILSRYKVEIEGNGLSALTDSKGFFEIKDLQGGESYNLIISKKGYLTRKISSVKVNGSTVIGSQSSPVAIWAGDINQDNAINMLDIMQIAKVFGLSSSDAAFVSCADVNMDNFINMKDVIIIAKNFNNNTSDYPSIVIK